MRAWLALLAACGGPDDDSGKGRGGGDCLADPMTLALGTGTTTFVALAPGDAVTMVHGGQGGWHVDVAGQLAHTSQTVALEPVVTLTETEERIAGDQPVDYTALSGFDPTTCTGTFAGRRAFVDDVPGTDQDVICGFAGRAARLELHVEDPGSGRAADAAVEVRLALDPADVPACP